ncbi:MAG: integrase core domain-containing protein, partial [Nitrososphaerota archaeon]
QLCSETNTKQIFGAPYNPQSQGQIERFNRTLKNLIFRHFTLYNTKIWKDSLQQFVESYNNTVHSSTQAKPLTEIRKVAPKPPEPPKLRGRDPQVGDLVRLSL